MDLFGNNADVNNAVSEGFNSVNGFILDKIINPLIFIGTIIAVVYFLYGVAKYVYDKNQQANSYTDGNRHMLMGLIGMTIMFTALTITYFIGNTGNKLFMKAGGNDATSGLDRIQNARPR